LLERAVRIREKTETNLAKLAEVHFALGRALWQCGLADGDTLLCQRAHALVERAEQEFAQAPPTPLTLRERTALAAWQADAQPSVNRRMRSSK
jgi:hypothetical protein